MTVPGRVEAASLLLSHDPRPRLLRHSRAVAEIAGWLAARIEANGTDIDRRLVEAAALLHDVDKALPPNDPARALRHGDGSAAWLTRAGFGELARAVANHPVTRLADDAAYAAWNASAGLPERVVAYADKRAAQRLQPTAARFASWARRYPERRPPDVERRVRERAARLEAEVCGAAGCQPSDVRRLRWTERAFGPAMPATPVARAAIR